VVLAVWVAAEVALRLRAGVAGGGPGSLAESAWHILVLLLLAVQAVALSASRPDPRPAPSPTPLGPTVDATAGRNPPHQDPAPRVPTADRLEEAWRALSEQLRSLREEWVRETGRRAADRPSGGGRAEAAQTAELAERLKLLLAEQNAGDPSLVQLEGLAARLRAPAADAGEQDATPAALSAPLPPEKWLAAAPDATPLRYVVYLAEAERTAREAVGRSGPSGEPAASIDWRGQAEGLLPLVSQRRDPRFQSLREDLLQLLGYEEIPVSIGDAIDRQVHEVEEFVDSPSTPNRVLKIGAPGYRVAASGEIWRKARVTVSRQPAE